MIIIQGKDKIEQLINQTKYEVVKAMVKEGKITRLDADEFNDKYVGIFVTNTGFFTKFFNKEASDDQGKAMIVKTV